VTPAVIWKKMFLDRIDAANQLADKLQGDSSEILGKDTDSKEITIPAIPRGGVIIGDIIASRLGATLDLVIVRKIRAPFNPELGIGAVMPDGVYFVDMNTVQALGIPHEYIATEVSEQLREINRRIVSYRGSSQYDNLEGKVVILVDDGIATGSTIYAAAQWVKCQKCKKLIIAVPIASKHALEMLRDIADIVISIHSPESFEGVGQFYQDFSQVTDEEVMAIMRKYSDESKYGQSPMAE
jgi:putative phosphoribosyl transferase